METSEQFYRLADTTYRNTEELMTDLKRLVSAAKAYHKVMESMASASENFFLIVESIGAKATHLPGAVCKLGGCMVEMVEGYKRISTQEEDWMNSLNTDFIVPLESKLASETKTITSSHKAYKQDSANRESLVEKTSGKLKSALKKKNPSRTHLEKQMQLKEMLTDYSQELQSTRVEGLRKALIEERKMYCFVVEHFCTVVHNQITYNTLSHQVLSTQVNGWSSLCSTPNELPPESAILLVNPRSPRAFPGDSINTDDDTDSGPQGEQDGAARLRTRRKSCRVKVLYPHQRTASGQLEINAGDLVDAIADPQEGWQFGENIRTGKSGWFPVQYAEQIWPTPEPTRRKTSPAPGQPPVDMNGLNINPQPSPVSIPERDYGPPDQQQRSGQS